MEGLGHLKKPVKLRGTPNWEPEEIETKKLDDPDLTLNISFNFHLFHITFFSLDSKRSLYFDRAKKTPTLQNTP